MAGNYAGTAIVQYPELNLTYTCPATTTVTQSGATVNVGNINLGAQCGQIQPIGTVTIDYNGNIPSSTGTFSCSYGGNYNYSASGSFAGTTLRVQVSASSNNCLNYNFSATMNR